MFGYFRPYEALENTGAMGRFSAHYCRLCYCLRSIGGQKARAFTTFDATVYGIICCIDRKIPSPPMFPCQRFKTGNMRFFSSDEFGIRLAYVSLIAFGEKLRDDKLDNGRTIKNSLASLVYGKLIKRAEEKEAEITKISRRGTDKVNELQKSGASLRDVIGAYGESVSDVFYEMLGIGAEAKALIGAIAEWTFFVDMLCDYDEDVKEESPNTLINFENKTLFEYFNNNYQFVMEENDRIVKRILEPLLAIDDGSEDWRAIYHIITHSLDTVVPNLLSGEDVTFHYTQELTQNYKRMRSNNKLRKKLKGKCDE
jgi:hypothetical protein